MESFKKSEFDLTIIGAGPAGLTACLYAVRAGLNVLLLERMVPGGYLNMIDTLENYPGFSESISGIELAGKIARQLQRYRFTEETAEVRGLEPVPDGKWKIRTADKEIVSAALIVATGSRPRKIEVPGEDVFTGKGVSYCAVCDGPLFRGKEVVVIGGGNSAVEEALFLARFCSGVTIIHRRDSLRADKVYQERARENPKVRFILSSVCTGIYGNLNVESVRVRDNAGRERDVSCSGVFVFIGHHPETGFLKGLLELDPTGYIVTGPDLSTSRPGIFAAGDCRVTFLRQVITACADGALASDSCRKYLESSGN